MLYEVITLGSTFGCYFSFFPFNDLCYSLDFHFGSKNRYDRNIRLFNNLDIAGCLNISRMDRIV